MTKRNIGRSGGDATQVFRQFAWHLAGTLTNAKAVTRPAARKPRVARTGAGGS
jgi:hypothetical protein